MDKLLILLIFFVTTAFGQEKKLEKLLGPDFRPITARTHIPYMEINPVYVLVPSITLLGDTSGIVYQNEFVLFRNYSNLSHNSTDGRVSYLKNEFVSNAEYQEFQKWIRDSLARERIYRGVKSHKEAIKYLNITKKELKSKTFYIDDREENRKNFDLNWKTSFSYNEPHLMPFVADLYLPQSERFYKFRDFDERIFIYQYEEKTDSETNVVDFQTPTISNESFWEKESASMNDEVSVLGQIYDRAFPELPLVGITGMQANAFCHWKEINLQQQLNKKHLLYKVRVTLPLVSELDQLSPTLQVDQRDYSQQWKITLENYQSFMKAVRDSIVMEHLYAHLCLANSLEANQMLQYKANYFDEYSLKYADTDPSDQEVNRNNFPLTADLGVLKHYPELVNAIVLENKENLYNYCYWKVNIAGKAVIGKLVARFTDYKCNKKLEFFYTSEIDSATRRPIGMDVNMDYMNKLCQGTGVRGHERGSNRFIQHEYVDITPHVPMENQNPEDLIKGISYEQALAYYHWRFPIWRFKAEDDWQQFVYPDEIQFTRVQKGEQVIIPAHEINFPSPTFRYVVTFIPLNN